jgi:hypothetical protein
MPRIAIHIGLHKTGTTYIQSTLLPYLTGVSLIRGWLSHREMMAADFSKTLVISDESLSGALFSGNYYNDFLTKIQKLKTLYVNPKIIIGIRKHDGFLLSTYKQYLHEKGTGDFSTLFNEEETGLIKHHELLLMEKLNLLKKEFSDVFVYSQESLRERPQDFLDGLCQFLEVENNIVLAELKRSKSNVGVNTKLQVATLRRLNRFNKGLERIHPLLSLYSKVFRKLNLTPRNICQQALKRIKSEKFLLPSASKAFIEKMYQKDWETAEKQISY